MTIKVQLEESYSDNVGMVYLYKTSLNDNTYIEIVVFAYPERTRVCVSDEHDFIYDDVMEMVENEKGARRMAQAQSDYLNTADSDGKTNYELLTQ